jgi:hypothetical protein
MKLFCTLIAFLCCHVAEAIPHQPFTVEEFSGVVESAVWRGSFELNRVFATPMGEPQDECIDTVPEHWILVLKDTKGLTEEQRGYISWAYARLPIDQAWRSFTRNLQKTHLYLLISAPKDWPVKIGSTVTVKGLKYEGMDFEGSYIVKEILIDGKPVKLPEQQLLPNWKTVEQAGTGQPATRPEPKSEGSDKPQPEAEGRSR